MFGILFEKVDSIKNPWGVTPGKGLKKRVLINFNKYAGK
tara:strand:+ start:2002 stop:2118 length:117 start_codon:yes stop_codon:yes gene_type:complete